MPIPIKGFKIVPGEICQLCGGQVVERINSLTSEPFRGCIRYPKCTYLLDLIDEEEEVEDQFDRNVRSIIRDIRDIHTQ